MLGLQRWPTFLSWFPLAAVPRIAHASRTSLQQPHPKGNILGRYSLGPHLDCAHHESTLCRHSSVMTRVLHILRPAYDSSIRFRKPNIADHARKPLSHTRRLYELASNFYLHPW